MAIEIKKTRRVRFHKTDRLQEDEPFIMRGDSFSPPEGAMQVANDLYIKCTMSETHSIYEIWVIKEVN